MSTRNKLLERIVLALGGTVTNPNNRNQLLQDWLNAVGGSPPSTRLAANLNGLTQYAQLGSESVFASDFTISMTTTRQSETKALFGGGNISRIIEHQDGRIEIANNQSLNLFGALSSIPVGQVFNLVLERVGSTVTVYADGANVGSGTYTESFSVIYIGRSWNENLFRAGISYDYSDSNGNIHAMNDGWPNNPTMANSGTGSNGTWINLTEASWEEITA